MPEINLKLKSTYLNYIYNCFSVIWLKVNVLKAPELDSELSTDLEEAKKSPVPVRVNAQSPKKVGLIP